MEPGLRASPADGDIVWPSWSSEGELSHPVEMSMGVICPDPGL